MKILSLVRGMSIYFFGNAVNALVPFLLIPLYTRFMSPSDYGLIAIFQSVIVVFSTFIGMNTIGAIIKKYYDLDETKFSLYTSACIYIFFGSLLIALLFLLPFASKLSCLLDVKEEYLFAAFLVSSFTFIYNLRIAVYQVTERPRTYIIWIISCTLFNSLMSVIFVAYFNFGADGRVVSSLACFIIFGSLAFTTLRNEKLISFGRFKEKYAFDALKFGLPLFPHVLAGFILTSFDRLVISDRLSMDDVGYYMLAVQISLIVFILSDSINKAFMPWLFSGIKGSKSNNRQVIVKVTISIYALVFLVASGFVLFADDIVFLLGGDAYLASAPVVKVLLLAQAISIVYTLASNYLINQAKTLTLTVISVFTGFIHVFFSILLVGDYEILGVGYSYLIAMTIRSLIIFIVAQKIYPLPWGKTIIYILKR